MVHAAAFAAAFADPPDRALDLGSGGGLPGLVLALRWPASQWVLLDSSTRRTRFLRDAVAELGLEGRAEVAEGRAEVAGRDPAFRGKFGAVFSRSFGPPAVTAECGAPFLRVRGLLVVSEPPDGQGRRWPPDRLAALGLAPQRRLSGPPALQVLVQAQPCDERYPRRVGVPAKRPLF